MDELSNCEANGIEASPSSAGTTIERAGENFTSAPKSTLLAALSYTQGTVENVVPPAIPDQSQVLTGLHSVSPDIGPVQSLTEKNLHDVNLFQPTKQPLVDTILRQLSSTKHAVRSSQLPAVDIPDVDSIMGPDLHRKTGLHSIQPIVDMSQSPMDAGAHDANSLQLSVNINQSAVNSHLHELGSVQNSMSSIQPLVYTVLRDVNSMQSVGEPKDTILNEHTTSSLHEPVGTILPDDVNSISSVEIGMHDMNSLQQPSFSLSQQPVEVEVNHVQNAMDAAQSVDNGLPIVPRVMRTKRSFTTEFKLECVEHAERTKNKTQTARIFNVNRRRVQEWCTQKERLMSVPKQQKRLSGAGKKQMSIDGEGKANHELRSFSSKSELDNEAIKDLSLSMSANAIDPTLFDCIARNLSNIDHSMLSASMVKMLQEWSEFTSQDGKAMEESMAQDTVPIMEGVLQKTDSSPSSQFLVMEVMDDGNLTEQPKEVGLESRGIPHSAAQHPPTLHQEVVAAEYILGTNNGQNSVSIEGPVVNIGVAGAKESMVNTSMTDAVNQVLHTNSIEGEAAQRLASAVQQGGAAAEFNMCTDSGQDSVNIRAGAVVNNNMTDMHGNPDEGNSISPLIPENTPNVPVAILDALMQVASVQLASPMEQMTAMETSISPSEQHPVALVLNGTGNRAKVEASPSSTTMRTRVKKSYTVEFKLDCIAHAESTSKCAAARQFNVDRRRVQDWCSKKEKLQKLSGGQHMLREAKEQMDNDVEKQLAAWVKRQQEAGEHLTRKMVGDEATRIYKEKGDMEFLYSIGWVAKFMVRNNISLVSRTCLPSYLPLVETIVDATTSS